ncbi:hypothetical protein Aperf_G00000131791 [Anoplocephala perfoliata]
MSDINQTGYPPGPGYLAAPGYPQGPGYPPWPPSSQPPPGYPPGPGYPAAPGYPQGPGYPPWPPSSQPPPATIVHTTNALGPKPTRFYCTSCQREILTDVTYVSGEFTWLLAVVILIFGGVLGCCLIPFCCDCDKDAFHSCPNCKANLGRYTRL